MASSRLSYGPLEGDAAQTRAFRALKRLIRPTGGWEDDLRVSEGEVRQFLRNNGLSLTLLALFLASLAGQAVTGWKAHSEQLRVHGDTATRQGDHFA